MSLELALVRAPGHGPIVYESGRCSLCDGPSTRSAGSALVGQGRWRDGGRPHTRPQRPAATDGRRGREVRVEVERSPTMIDEGPGPEDFEADCRDGSSGAGSDCRSTVLNGPWCSWNGPTEKPSVFFFFFFRPSFGEIVSGRPRRLSATRTVGQRGPDLRARGGRRRERNIVTTARALMTDERPRSSSARRATGRFLTQDCQRSESPAHSNPPGFP